ncbi:MAG: PAS domain S-box protein [Campylobacterota bacterium]|nr:PAS domain S-box protein [Campylobacterota bacterium]
MKKLKITGLKNSIVLYIMVGMLFLTATVVYFTFSYNKAIQETKHKSYSKQINLSMNHVLEHFIRDYTFHALRISKTTALAELLQKRDREGVYRLLKVKYDFMKEENENFKVMHVHLSDGSSFLRLHEPDKHSDMISQKRAMLREIHKEHKLLTGYETGMYATPYRIIAPIVNKQGVYLGAIELGLHPNFLLKTIYEINGFCGIMLIKDEKLQLFSKPNKVVIDNYRLQSPLEGELKDICGEFQALGTLKEGIELESNGKKYITHMLVLKNFENEDSVKLIFFQDITNIGVFLEDIFFKMLFTLFVILLFMALFIYRRVGVYEDDVDTLYEGVQEEILKSKNYLEMVFDTVPQIMITTDGEQIDNANKTMLEFFQFDTLEGFKNEHNCICEYFLDELECVTSDMHGVSWLEYVIRNSETTHRVCMRRDGVKYRFIVTAEPLNVDKKSRTIVTFSDVTELDMLSERLEIAVKGTQDGLWDWNVADNSLYLSPRWKEMLGYADDELENSFDTWKSRVHPDDIDEALRKIEICHNEKDVEYNYTHRLRHKDGSWVWILDRGETLFDEDKKAVRMVGFHTDITKQKELELQLKEDEELYFDFFEHTKSANIMYTTEDDGKSFKIKAVNSLVEELEGVKCEDIIGKRVDEVFEGVEEFGLLSIFKEVYKTGKAVKMPVSLYEDENIKGWRENYIFKLTNGDIVASYEDRTEEKRLDLLLTNTINSVKNLIFVKDTKFNYIECNRAFEEFIGKSREEIIDKNDYELFEKDMADFFRRKDEEMYAYRGVISNYEWVTYPDRKRVYLLTLKSPLKDDKGEIVGMVGNSVDLTELKELEDSLRESKEQFDEFMKYIPANIFVKDEEKRFIYANDTGASFFNGIDIIGKSSFDLLSGTNLEYSNMIDEEILEKGHIDRVLKFTDMRGEERVYRVLGFVMQEKEKNKFGTVIVDITQSHQDQEKLKDQEKIMIAQSRHAAMGEMISMIAHQWRQPISVIAMDANNVLVDIELESISTDSLRKDVEDIIEQTKHLSKTIDDFRNFFKPNKVKDEVLISDVFMESFRVISKSLDNNNIEYENSYNSQTKVNIFSRELLQVFINLLKNSKEALEEHRKENRKIKTSISETQENIIVEICDNGGGIPNDIISRVFDPYFSTKSEKNGTGLGLYMSKIIIEKHLFGTLSVNNKDDGACFRVELAKEEVNHD